MALILFINPVRNSSPGRGELLKGYLSLGSLASALRDPDFVCRLATLRGRSSNGCPPSFDVRVIHLEPGLTEEAMERRIVTDGGECPPPLVVGVTATAVLLDWARTVARVVARLWPESFRLAGGPHCSVAPEPLLGSGLFQAACLGEGVETVVELALELCANGSAHPVHIPGLAWMDPAGLVRYNERRRFVLDLDHYPYPSRSLDLFLPGGRIKAQREDELVFILAGHGCPNNCSFCAQKAIHGGRIRERSADSIMAEIESLVRFGYHRFALVQETFLNQRSRMERFLRLIEERGINIEWTVEARGDQIDHDLLVRMKTAGLKIIQIGLETADHELLNRIEKSLCLKDMADLIKSCAGLKIDTALYLLVGLPGQDWPSILRTARFIRENTPYNRSTGHVSVAVALPYPGTRLAVDGRVRIVRQEDGTDWPARTPTIGVDARGALHFGEVTETDVMTAREVSESFFFLDDYAQFLIQAQKSSPLDPATRMKAGNHARRLFGMIVQRAIRDLVIQAQPDLNTPKRKKTLKELIVHHGHEIRIDEMTEPELGLEDKDFLDFLDRVRFMDGYRAIGLLSWKQRLRLMRLCTLVWTGSNRAFFKISFRHDSEQAGVELAGILDGIPLNTLCGSRKKDGFLLARSVLPDGLAILDKRLLILDPLHEQVCEMQSTKR